MDIGYYIADLLRNQDEVSLPGIGTFVKMRVAGSYNADKNLFAPPSYRISLIDISDSPESLARHISAHKNLSQTSAEYFIKKFISSLFDLLQSTGIAEIKPLGLIRKDNEKLSFEASPDFAIAGRFYGLRPVSEQAMKRPAGEEALFENIFREEEEKDIETTEPGEELYEEAEASSFSLAKLLGAAAVALILAAGLLYAFNPRVNEIVSNFVASGRVNETVTETGNNESLIPADSIRTGMDTAVADGNMNDTSAIVPALIVEEDTVSYEIIGGSFGRMSEAETYIQQLSSKGIAAKIANNIPGNLVKVSLGSFNDEQSAQRELNRIHKEVNKDAWIYRPKLKKTQ